MAGVFRVKTQAGITGNVGHVGPFELDRAISVDEWFGPYTYEVATGTTDQAIAVIDAAGLTTVTALVVTTDQNISITLGATVSNDAFAINQYGHLAVIGTSLTAVSVDNASGSTANITFLIAGT